LPDPAGEEPIYLVLEDVLELYAAIGDEVRGAGQSGRGVGRQRR
jgi:hypothetical protein